MFTSPFIYEIDISENKSTVFLSNGEKFIKELTSIDLQLIKMKTKMYIEIFADSFFLLLAPSMAFFLIGPNFRSHFPNLLREPVLDFDCHRILLPRHPHWPMPTLVPIGNPHVGLGCPVHCGR